MRKLALVLGLLALCSCVWIPFYENVPHAIVEVVLPKNATTEDTFAAADRVILSLGYIKGKGGGPEFESEYVSSDFRINYYPESEGVRGGVTVFRLHFYQYGRRQFNQTGIDRFEDLKNALIDADLVLPPEMALSLDVKLETMTPTDFNRENPPPSFEEYARRARGGAFALGMYSIFVLIPGFWSAIRYFRKITGPLFLKRSAFAALCSLCLSPGIFPFPTMFGPILLVPFPFGALWIFELGEIYAFALAISVGCTLLVAGLLSLFILKKAVSCLK
jgi:hypothetical protein